MSGGTGKPPPLPGEVPAEISAIAWTPVAVIALMTIAILFLRWRSWMLAKRATDAASFENALNSDKLEVLGYYLRDKLGALRLDDFADSEEARERIRKYMRRLRDYVNQPSPPAAIHEEADLFETDIDAAPPTISHSPIPIAISEAQNLLSQNKGWSAFALLRRELELALRRKGSLQEGRSLPSPQSIEPKSIRPAYGIFLRIANRSIHGEDITGEEEERAVKAAIFLFEHLDEIKVKTGGFPRSASFPSSA